MTRRVKPSLIGWLAVPTVAVLLLAAPDRRPSCAAEPAVTLDRDDDAGVLRVLIGGEEAIVYQYAADLDLVHYYPVRSPSGGSMTVQHPDPYPHHRSFWFADRVQLEGQRAVNFYGALYSKADKSAPKSPYRDRIRHVEFLPPAEGDAGKTVVRTKLLWEMDLDKPVLEEVRSMRVAPLGEGEYFLDVTFTVTAAFGDVTFVSDAVHYAWPYIRMNGDFNVQTGGGTITSSTGGVNQAGTNGKEAVWIDYSHTADGVSEGLAIFSSPDNPQPHKWLTRDYGCFGPRRPDERSGKPFTLAEGESLSRRVGILVHRGDVKGGKVAEWYERYVNGKL